MTTKQLTFCVAVCDFVLDEGAHGHEQQHPLQQPRGLLQVHGR
jgi:hypothetical protein